MAPITVDDIFHCSENRFIVFESHLRSGCRSAYFLCLWPLNGEIPCDGRSKIHHICGNIIIYSNTPTRESWAAMLFSATQE